MSFRKISYEVRNGIIPSDIAFMLDRAAFPLDIIIINIGITP